MTGNQPRFLFLFPGAVGTAGNMRQLEELNLVDNFLVNSLTSHKLYGEPAARSILECILGRKPSKIKVMPQHFIQGGNTDRHGVRLDVYLDENDGTGELRKLHEMVTAIKTDGEAGLAYMKFFELEERTLQKGIRQGKVEGRAEDILDILCELGKVSLDLREQVCSQKDDAILRTWLRLAVKAESIQDFEQKAFADCGKS